MSEAGRVLGPEGMLRLTLEGLAETLTMDEAQGLKIEFGLMRGESGHFSVNLEWSSLQSFFNAAPWGRVIALYKKGGRPEIKVTMMQTSSSPVSPKAAKQASMANGLVLKLAEWLEAALRSTVLEFPLLASKEGGS